MEDLTKPEPIKLWQGRVALARRFQEQFGDMATAENKSRWEQNRRAMAGDFNSRAELGDEAVDVNMVRSTVKSVLPPLWLGQPHIAVKPTQARFKGANNVRMAEVTEVEINYWIRELDVRSQVRKVVHDAECTNVGYLYVNYVKDKTDVEVDGERIEMVPTIRHKQPYVRRHRPSHVLVPPGHDDLDAAPWVDIIFLMPLRHVVAKYGEAATEGLSETLSLKAEMDNATQDFTEYMNSDDAKIVEIHNCWCKETKKVYIFAEGHDKFLEEPNAWPYDPEGFPLVRYSPEYISDQYYGTPPINYYLQQNKELNATRTAMAKRRNRTKSVVFMESAIADQIGDKYRQAEDGEIIGVQMEDQERDLRAKIIIDSGLPFDVGDLQYDAVLKSDIREQSGLGAERRGGGDPNVDSATASANIEKGIQIREADRGDGVRSLYLGVAKRLWFILQKFPDAERSRLIAGPLAGQLTEFKYTLKELKGEFNFDMDFGAMLADTPDARSNRALLNYNLLRGDPLVDPNKLIFDVLKTQNTPDPESYMLRLRSPQEEHAMFGQGLPVEAHERDQHEEHLAAHDMYSATIDRQMQNIPMGAERERLALAQHLVIAHIQDHVRKVAQITGQEGKPMAENLLRNQYQANAGSETQAELGGKPLTGTREQLIQ